MRAYTEVNRKPYAPALTHRDFDHNFYMKYSEFRYGSYPPWRSIAACLFCGLEIEFDSDEIYECPKYIGGIYPSRSLQTWLCFIAAAHSYS